MNQRYHRQDVLNALADFVEANDKLPTAKDLRQSSREFVPSHSTVLKHFGSLTVAKRSVLIELGRRKKIGTQQRLPTT